MYLVKSQGDDPSEVVLEVKPHLQVVLEVESQGEDHSEVVLEAEPHLQVMLVVEPLRDSEVVE